MAATPAASPGKPARLPCGPMTGRGAAARRGDSTCIVDFPLAMVASRDPTRVLCVGTGELNGPPPLAALVTHCTPPKSRHSMLGKVNSEIAKCCRKCLKGNLASCLSLLNVIGNAYCLQHGPHSSPAGLGSPLRCATYQRGRSGNTVVLFWYDHKAESLCLA